MLHHPVAGASAGAGHAEAAPDTGLGAEVAAEACDEEPSNQRERKTSTVINLTCEQQDEVNVAFSTRFSISSFIQVAKFLLQIDFIHNDRRTDHAFNDWKNRAWE